MRLAWFYSQTPKHFTIEDPYPKRTGFPFINGRVRIPFLGAVVVKGSSENCVGVDAVLERGEVRAYAANWGA